MDILLCRTGDDAGRAHPIVGDRNVVGRGEDCDFALLDGQLSRHHAAVLRLDSGALAVEDLGSTNGTMVRGEPVPEGARRVIEHLDAIHLGPGIEFVYLDLSRVPCTEVVAAHLLDHEGNRVPLQVGVNTMGASDENDLIVTDEEVSAVHCQLVLSPSGVLITREPGARRIRVNGTEVESAALHDGDLVELSRSSEFGLEVVSGQAPAPQVNVADRTRPGLSTPETAAAADASPEPAPAPATHAGAGRPDVPAEHRGPAGGEAAGGDAVSAAAERVGPEEDEVTRVRAPTGSPLGVEDPEQADETLSVAPKSGSTLRRGGDASVTEELGSIQDSVRRARERRAQEVDSAAERKRAHEADTNAPGTGVLEAAAARAALEARRARGDGGGRRPTPQQPVELRAVRREAAARVTYRVPGEAEDRACLLREGRHVVGRHEGCRVIIGHESVSREHAEVRVGPQGVRVRDLGSENGIRHEGHQVEQVSLESGGFVQFGDILVRFEIL